MSAAHKFLPPIWKPLPAGLRTVPESRCKLHVSIEHLPGWLCERCRSEGDKYGLAGMEKDHHIVGRRREIE